MNYVHTIVDFTNVVIAYISQQEFLFFTMTLCPAKFKFILLQVTLF